MNEISRESLRAYLDDALSDADLARLESRLRSDEKLLGRLREVMQERDRGDHSLGAVWRRERLTCPTREQLGSYLLEVLESDHQKYIDFHLKTVACPFCLANLDDLQEHQPEVARDTHTRRRRYYQSSAGLLKQR